MVLLFCTIFEVLHEDYFRESFFFLHQQGETTIKQAHFICSVALLTTLATWQLLQLQVSLSRDLTTKISFISTATFLHFICRCQSQSIIWLMQFYHKQSCVSKEKNRYLTCPLWEIISVRLQKGYFICEWGSTVSDLRNYCSGSLKLLSANHSMSHIEDVWHFLFRVVCRWIRLSILKVVPIFYLRI